MRIFLAAPFSSVYRKRTGKIDSKFRERLETIIKLITEKGHNVISAHVRENWGQNLMSPDEFTPLDLNLIKECNLVVAYLGHQPSGVYVELGWASALQKRIIVLAEHPISQLSPLVQGLSRITETTIISFRDENELVTKLATLL